MFLYVYLRDYKQKKDNLKIGRANVFQGPKMHLMESFNNIIWTAKAFGQAIYSDYVCNNFKVTFRELLECLS